MPKAVPRCFFYSPPTELVRLLKLSTCLRPWWRDLVAEPPSRGAVSHQQALQIFLFNMRSQRRERVQKLIDSGKLGTKEFTYSLIYTTIAELLLFTTGAIGMYSRSLYVQPLSFLISLCFVLLAILMFVLMLGNLQRHIRAYLERKRETDPHDANDK